MSKKIIATYEMITGYKNYPTNFGLAISEFIDNSIGSYQNNNVSNTIDGLMITIKFDNTNLNNKKIIITDNANGMSPDEMENAMQPNDRKGKKDTQYNQYGVGMKLGIFWYGSDCTIFSKRYNKNEYKLEFLTSTKNLNEEVYVEAIKSKDDKIVYNSGTTIEISHIYDGRDIVSKKNGIKELIDFLGWRYNKLIAKGLLIKIIIKTNEIKKNEELIVQQFSNKPFNMQQLFSDKKGKRLSKEIEKQRKDFYNKRINELYNKLEEKKSFSEEMINIFNKVNTLEDFVFSKEITINGKKVILSYAIMDAHCSNMNKYQGLTIYHLDRAIRHGPNGNKGEGMNSTMEFIERSGGSGQHPRYRWLYGEINLTGIENPDQNKNDFLWSSNGKEELIQQLREIYLNLKDFLEIISSTDEIEKNNLPNEREQQDIGVQLYAKLPNADIESVTVTKNSTNLSENATSLNKWKIFGELYDVIVSETNCINNFLDVKVDEYNKKIEILIQAENKLWKPLINNQDFKGELLYPFAIILGFSEWIYNNDDALEKFDKNKSKTFIEIIDELIKRWT